MYFQSESNIFFTNNSIDDILFHFMAISFVCMCFYPFESLVIIGAKFFIETHKTYLLKRKLDSFSIHWLLIFLIEIMKTALIEIYTNYYYLFTAVYSWANDINKKKKKNENRKVSFNKTWFQIIFNVPGFKKRILFSPQLFKWIISTKREIYFPIHFCQRVTSFILFHILLNW